MRIVWIASCDQRCGIAEYTRLYTDALQRYCSVEVLRPHEYTAHRGRFLARVNAADVVHIQYEPSLFRVGRRDSYTRICRHVVRPLMVTLHEVYAYHPDAYPRAYITGLFPVRMVKLLIYDMTHPLIRMERAHRKKQFYAHRLLVHAGYHTRILASQGIDAERVRVEPHPVPEHISVRKKRHFTTHTPVTLGTVGFINPHYDYELLFGALSRLRIPWRFVWIGGLRRAQQDRSLYRWLHARIARLRVAHKFTITGWVDTRTRNELLGTLDIALMLFRVRSSSGSLATAIGARKYIVTTRLPLVWDITMRHPLAVVSAAAPEAVAESITAIVRDAGLRRQLRNALDAYNSAYSYPQCAARLMDHYHEVGRV